MSEEFYDDEITPALTEIAKKCHEKGMNFLSTVEFEPNEIGTTAILENAGIEMKVSYLASKCAGNVDLLIMALLKDAKQNGHNSIYLKILLDMDNN